MISPEKIQKLAGFLCYHLSPLVKFAVDWKQCGETPSPGSEAETAARREYDIFISYRRDRGSEIARLLAEKLKQSGYRPFLDIDGLNSGEWGSALAQRIEECPDFVAIVTEGYFDRCVNEDDVVRREIALALTSKRNTIPLFVGNPDLATELPEEIGGICAHNGIKYLNEYSQQAFEKLCEFLSTPPSLGPRRLETGDLFPRLVVFCVFLAIGVWRGAMYANQVSNGYGYSMSIVSDFWNPLRYGLERGIYFCVFIVLPTMVILSMLAKRKGCPADLFYAGRWLPFWAVTSAALITVTTFFSGIATTWLAAALSWSGVLEWFFIRHAFIFGGFAGGATAIFWTRLIIRGNAWTKATSLLKSK
jgi:hypothetical protein